MFLQDRYVSKNLKHVAQRSHSEACSLKKCTLPYIYFVFKCLVLYFGIKKEWLEKSLNTFSLAANILKLKRNCSIRVAKTVTAKLICALVFAHADCWFSHGAAQIPNKHAVLLGSSNS